jgi:hypothetical protein
MTASVNRSWTPEQIEELKELASRNLSSLEIARRMGRTPVAISTKAWQLGLSFNKNGTRRQDHTEK